MEDKILRSIRSLGLIILISSICTILLFGLGIFLVSIIGTLDKNEESFIQVAEFIIVLSVPFLIGATYILKLKSWAKKLLLCLTGAISLCIFIMGVLVIYIGFTEDPAALGSIIILIVLGIPSALVFSFLNRSTVSAYFKRSNVQK